MGNSRNSSSSELPERVAAVLAPKIFPGAHLALGLSGGLDSVALLSILLELAPALKFSLRAVHVNHGISPNAARWAEFCTGLCAGLRVPFQLETVDIGTYRGLGLEGAARRSRYGALAGVDADFLVLAQHCDDQAETLLLRLLRGAGLRGLAAMAPLRTIPGTPALLVRDQEYRAALGGANRRAAAPAEGVSGRRPNRLCGTGLDISPLPRKAVPAARPGNDRQESVRGLGRRKRPADAFARRSAEVQAGRRTRSEFCETAREAGHRAPAAGRRAFAAGRPPAAPHAEEFVPGTGHSAMAPRLPALDFLRRGARQRSGHR